MNTCGINIGLDCENIIWDYYSQLVDYSHKRVMMELECCIFHYQYLNYSRRIYQNINHLTRIQYTLVNQKLKVERTDMVIKSSDDVKTLFLEFLD